MAGQRVSESPRVAESKACEEGSGWSLASSATASRATDVQFSPFAPEIFLVAQQDGCVRLHRVADAAPALAWPCLARADTNSADDAPGAKGQPTRGGTGRREGLFRCVPCAAARWSPHRPGVFYALYANGELVTFDLLKDDAQPVERADLARDLPRETRARVDDDARPPSAQPALALSAGAASSVTKLLAVARERPAATTRFSLLSNYSKEGDSFFERAFFLSKVTYERERQRQRDREI